MRNIVNGTKDVMGNHRIKTINLFLEDCSEIRWQNLEEEQTLNSISINGWMKMLFASCNVTTFQFIHFFTGIVRKKSFRIRLTAVSCEMWFYI